MINPDELEVIRKTMNDDRPLTFEEEKKLLMFSRLMINRVRWNRPISSHVHNACAGVYHIMDWSWNELIEAGEE